ncbi:hypothetical protein F5146DRAFT_1198349 [Armillaria mellea]|nr:hypothetical protein F5146DRAFT_1198349 [Armillaria mellea]
MVLYLDWTGETYTPKDITSTIEKFIEKNCLPHLLLYGPPGTRKTSAILAVARCIYGLSKTDSGNERGIDVVCEQIKQFTETCTLFSKGFKLIILDEVDVMTQVAQAALRQVIEQYTKNVRFCIICNYINKIAPAIQNQVEKRLVTVVETEKVRLTDDGKKALLKLLKGDMCRAVNVLQVCHAAYDIIGDVLVDLKARTEDQLNEAYTRIISMSPESFIVRPSVQVRQAETILPDLLSSLSKQTLVNHLNILRRDLMTNYVVYIHQEDISITISSNEISCPVERLLLPFHPPLPVSPSIPTGSAPPIFMQIAECQCLNNLLIPSVPSSFNKLYPFLDLVRHTVEFEDKFIIGVLGGDQHDNLMHNWADGVAGHYERQRRLQILDAARTFIVSPRNKHDVLTVEVELQTESRVVRPLLSQFRLMITPLRGMKMHGGLDSNRNGWEFDDEVEVESDEGKRENGDDGYDPGDALGWNDEDQSSSSEDVSEETAWGDPWGDIPTDDPAPPVPSLMSHEAAGTSAKIVNTDKAKVNGNSPTSFQNTAAPTVPHKLPEKRPPKLTLTVTYLVSG